MEIYCTRTISFHIVHNTVTYYCINTMNDRLRVSLLTRAMTDRIGIVTYTLLIEFITLHLQNLKTETVV